MARRTISEELLKEWDKYTYSISGDQFKMPDLYNAFIAGMRAHYKVMKRRKKYETRKNRENKL